ncbi:hypothetical protein, partial [Belliella pelovolcani]|uniref:hypothetical protein n=1 Tax=Belliella pelovolcani TaxID=529505 RepID=UPI00391B30D2
MNSFPKGLMQVSYEVFTSTDYFGDIDSTDDYKLSSMNPAIEKQKVEFVLYESGDVEINIEHFSDDVGLSIPHQHLPDDTPPIKKTEIFGNVISMYGADGELL